YQADKTFDSPYSTVLEEFQLPDKYWFIRLVNDYYNLVEGHVYGGDAYEALATTPEWISCPASSRGGGRRSLLLSHAASPSTAGGLVGGGKEPGRDRQPLREARHSAVSLNSSPAPEGRIMWGRTLSQLNVLGTNSPSGSPTAPPTPANLLYPEKWYNPETSFSRTYAVDTSTADGYSIGFGSAGVGTVTVTGDGASYLGPRYVATVAAPAVVVAVVDKTYDCNDHYFVFSTAADPGAWSWNAASDQVKFVWNCKKLMIYSTTDTVSNSDSCVSSYTQHQIRISISETSATLEHAQCQVTLELRHSLGADPWYFFIGADDDSHKGAAFISLQLETGGGNYTIHMHPSMCHLSGGGLGVVSDSADSVFCFWSERRQQLRGRGCAKLPVIRSVVPTHKDPVTPKER
ncbi:hypothetical protein CYMTET_31453, partial [Cymbomonas tetramitiformis]